MVPKVAQYFQRIDETTQLLFSDLGDVSPGQASFKPTPDNWSILQVLDHLFMAESGTLRYMRNKNKAESLDSLTIVPTVKTAILALFLLLPLKIKAPAVVSQPENAGELDDIQRQWKDHRQALQQFLSDLPLNRTRKMIFRHPFIGPMNIYHTLTFLNYHLIHHRRQIKRLLKHPQFPKS